MGGFVNVKVEAMFPDENSEGVDEKLRILEKGTEFCNLGIYSLKTCVYIVLKGRVM